MSKALTIFESLDNNEIVIAFLKKLFTSEKVEPDIMKYLIVGLGNIGSEYDNTRHNIGFEILDFLAKQKEVEFENDHLGALATFKFKGRTFVMLKPNTYMNLSGKSVRYWLQKHNVKMENLLVVLDDLNLPYEKMRMRKKGKDGGHNGLKDIDRVLGQNNYARLRFGIGNQYSKGQQVDFVLGEWTVEEEQAIGPLKEKACKAILAFGTIGAGRAMSEFNK